MFLLSRLGERRRRGWNDVLKRKLRIEVMGYLGFGDSRLSRKLKLKKGLMIY